jgi:Nif-specific regulatory protein
MCEKNWTLPIPPLRERGNDIVTLAEYFVARYSRETEKSVKTLSTPALHLLMQHTWPGNVRELENVIHRAVILAEGNVIHTHDLPLTLQCPASADGHPPGGLDSRLNSIEYEMIVEALRLHHGNISEAAKSLQLTRRSMGLRMKRFKLNYKQFR